MLLYSRVKHLLLDLLLNAMLIYSCIMDVL